jgi:hypothetical protein
MHRSHSGERKFRFDNCTTYFMWPKILLIASLAAWLVWTGFAFARVFAYYAHAESKYYNPSYAEENKVAKVALHASFGWLAAATVSVFAWRVARRSKDGAERGSPAHRPLVGSSSLARNAELTCGFVAAALEIATLVSVMPISSGMVLRARSGIAAVLTAFGWTLACAATGIWAAVLLWRHSARAADVTCLHACLVVYGFLLLPILYGLADRLAASAVVLLLALAAHIAAWIVLREWGGLVVNRTPGAPSDNQSQ